MIISGLIFWCCTLTLLVSAAIAVLTRNYKYSLFSFFLTLIGSSGILISLSAELYSTSIIVISFGASIVFLILALILTNSYTEIVLKTRDFRKYITPLAVIVIFILLLKVVNGSIWKIGEEYLSVDTVRLIGELFLSRYFLVIELVSLMMVIIIIGAVYLMRKS